MSDFNFDKASMLDLAEEINSDLSSIKQSMENIKAKLTKEADGKKLKGDELVGWLGEIYAKLFLSAKLDPDDTNEHDVYTDDKKLISVKARKGKSWRDSSAIPKIEGADSPTHLLFIRLKDDYSPHSIWLFPWQDLAAKDRFIKHIVRGEHRSWKIRINEKTDKEYLVFTAE